MPSKTPKLSVEAVPQRQGLSWRDVKKERTMTKTASGKTTRARELGRARTARYKRSQSASEDHTSWKELRDAYNALKEHTGVQWGKT